LSLEHIDGPQLRRLLAAGTAMLYENKEEVDALNVFPVPDGDTGTNMYLTFLSALREVEKTTDDRLQAVVESAAQGALMGARGNSGVIVSQFFRGFARAVGNANVLKKEEIAKGIEGASNLAYQAVRKPVEGTILTVVREAAGQARKLLEQDLDLLDFIEGVYFFSEIILSRTTDMLPTLKQAGVVDAGGKGLLFFVRGMLEAMKGSPLADANFTASSPEKEGYRIASGYVEGDMELEEITFQYCTEFILKGDGLEIELIRQDLTPHGDCLLVVGDEKTAKIHLHTNNPGLILDYAVRLGEMCEIQIHNMVEQSQQRLEKIKQNVPDSSPVKEIGLVAVVPGEGLQQIYRSLGVDEIIEGGQTMNPSTEDIYRAVERVSARQVIILPNNSNVIMTAGQVGELAPGPIEVVPTKTIPQGVTALMAFNPQADLRENAEAMTRAISSVQTGEVTYAVRDSSFNGLTIKEGDVIGLWEDNVVASGKEPGDILLELVQRYVEREDALISIYYGKDVSADSAQLVLNRLQDQMPNAEIELYYGGQPLYYYVFSVE
jgi:DAK2 domain fusion protein YloV